MIHLHHQDFRTFTTRTEDAVAWITSVPHVSVHSDDLLEDLTHLCEVLEDDISTKAVVFQSAHAEVFVCHAHTTFPADADEPSRLLTVLQRVSTLPQVTIAKVEGAAHGGGFALALACDMRFATHGKASFAIGFELEDVRPSDNGALCAVGSMARLSKLIGPGRAIELAMHKSPIKADVAEKYGLVNMSLHQGEISGFVTRLTASIGSRPGREVVACKRIAHASVNVSVTDALKEECCWLSVFAEHQPGQESNSDSTTPVHKSTKKDFGSPKAIAQGPA